MTLSELEVVANGIFSSILVFCPDFPASAQTSTTRKFEQLSQLIETALERIHSDDAKRWLRIALQEIQESRQYYERGDRKMGMTFIQGAHEHFKNAFSSKQTEPRFIGSETGSVQDSDSGFPS